MTARRTLAALWTLAVLVACSIPGDALRSFAILTPDKLYHALAFIGFALVWRWAGVRPLAVLVSGIAFAVFIEVWQATLPIGRFADPYDTLADIVGLLFGLWTARVAQKARAKQSREGTFPAMPCPTDPPTSAASTGCISNSAPRWRSSSSSAPSPSPPLPRRN